MRTIKIFILVKSNIDLIMVEMGNASMNPEQNLNILQVTDILFRYPLQEPHFLLHIMTKSSGP